MIKAKGSVILGAIACAIGIGVGDSGGKEMQKKEMLENNIIVPLTKEQVAAYKEGRLDSKTVYDAFAKAIQNKVVSQGALAPKASTAASKPTPGQ